MNLPLPKYGRTGILAALVWALQGPLPQAAATALEVKANQARTFYVDSTAGQSQVSISSESTLEDFTIICDNVGGQWQFNPKDVETIKGRFFIRPADLRTGIELRDHDLRDPEWLDAAKYPEIVINVTGAQNVARTAANTATMSLAGTCSIHGVTKDVQIPCTLTYLDQSPVTMRISKGDLIRIRANFAIKLSDYHVYGPKGGVRIIGLKVSDRLPIRVTVFGSTEKPAAPLKIDRPGAATMPAGATSQPAPSVLQPPAPPKGQ